MDQRFGRWTLLVFCSLAFALRVAGLDYQSLWRDEVDTVRFASRPLNDLLHTFVAPGENGPLYYLLMRPWLRWAGEGEFALRFASVACGVVAVPLCYRLARRLFPGAPAVALIGALLMTTSPYLVWYGQEGRMYALVVMLGLLSVYLFLAALDMGGWQRWLGYAFVTGAAFYVHLALVLIVPVQVLVFVLYDSDWRSARWKAWLLSLALLIVAHGPLLAWQIPQLLTPAQTGYPFVPLPELLRSALASYSLGVVEGAPFWLPAVTAGLPLAAVLLFGDEVICPASVRVLLVWLVMPLIGLFLVSLVRPLYTARYLVFVVPAYVLLLAAGVVATGRRAPLFGGLLLVALLTVNAWNLRRQATTPIKADFRAATHYVESYGDAEDLILFQIPYGRHSFEYYARLDDGLVRRQQPLVTWKRSATYGPGAPKRVFRVFLPRVTGRGGMPYRWAEGVYTNGGMDPSELDRRMAEVVADASVVWLVATEVPMWDERGLVQAWLEERGILQEEAQFTRVSVSRFELR